MLQILLLILKILGTVLLVLLGTMICLILVVLFVPIRYRVSIKWGNEFTLDGIISWLLHFIHAHIIIIEGKTHFKARIFGILVFDSDRPRKTKETKPSKERYSASEKKNNRKRDKDKDRKGTEEDPITEKPEIIDLKDVEEETKDHSIMIEEKEDPDRAVQTDTNTIQKNLNQEKQAKAHKKHSIFQKILVGLRKLRERIKSFFLDLYRKMKTWFRTFLDIKRKGRLILEFLRDELNQEAFRLSFSSLKKILKHILPTKLKANFVFGTGDPCSTGQILGILGILYSFYGDKLQITPDFENQRLEGDLEARGRIRLATLLIIVIKLLLDRRFKQLRYNLKILKEAL